MGAVSFALPDIGLTVIALAFAVAVTGGSIVLSHEHDAAEWVPFFDISVPPWLNLFWSEH